MGIHRNTTSTRVLLFLSVVILLPFTARSVDVEPDGSDGDGGDGGDGAGAVAAVAGAGDTNQVGLPSAKSRQAARHADKFPVCPETRVDPKLTDAEAAAVGTDSDRGDQRTADVKYLIAAVESSGIRPQPFKSSVHICQPFREELFQKLYEAWRSVPSSTIHRPPPSIVHHSLTGHSRAAARLTRLQSSPSHLSHLSHHR